MKILAVLFKKRVVRTKLDIYLFITVTWSIPLLVNKLVTEGIILSVFSASALTLFNIYIFIIEIYSS